MGPMSMGGMGGMGGAPEKDEYEQIRMVLKKAGFSDEQIATFSPEQMKAMYQDFGGEEALIQQQRGQAEAIRDASKAGMGGTQAGDIYMADSPLETLASIGGDAYNAYQQRQMNEKQDALNQSRSQGMQGMGALGAMARGDISPEALAIRQQKEEEERRKRAMI